jgi:hypothetical protein
MKAIILSSPVAALEKGQRVLGPTMLSWFLKAESASGLGLIGLLARRRKQSAPRRCL